MTRIVFMGTPDFAVPTLEALCTSGPYKLVGIYTQPDRPAGRARELKASPVKTVAIARNLPVFQPLSLRRPEAQAELAALRPDVIVVAAYGLILPREALDTPPHGCVNVHASLLPRYRGAAPIPAAILSGDSIAGVTIMRMDAGVDTGPTLAQAELPIQPDDTGGSLTTRLASLGADLLARTLPRWLEGDIEPQAQDESHATLSPRMNKEDGRLDWSRPALELERRVRAYDPWPGTFTLWGGKRLKVTRARVRAAAAAASPVGQVVQWEGGVGVACGQDILELVEVQIEGKRAMSGRDFGRGQPAFVGAQLGAF